MIEISLDKHDACYSYSHDANIYGDEFAIGPFGKNEIIAIAPTLDSSLNEKHDCNDAIINSINANWANDMQSYKLEMTILLCPLLIAMIMIDVMLLMILKFYLRLMMNMILI